MQKQSIETSVGTLTLIEPFITKLTIKEGITFDVKETYEIRSANLALTDGGPFCILLDAQEFFTSTAEARQLSASKEFSKGRIAIAMLMTSLPLRMLGNFFIKFNKPASPTKIFTNEADAIKWLKAYRDKKINWKKSMLILAEQD